MTSPLEPISTVQDLEALIEASSSRPVLLFKHSVSCGTSAQAFDELHEHLAGQDGSARYGVVVVQSHRAVSTAVAQRLGIRHETPQALLLVDGRVAWHASHFRVTAQAIAAALAALAPASSSR